MLSNICGFLHSWWGFALINCPWSLYRLLSQARLNVATNTSVDITFAAPDGGMRYRVSTEKANNPFTQPLFKGFALPQTLLRDGIRAGTEASERPVEPTMAGAGRGRVG